MLVCCADIHFLANLFQILISSTIAAIAAAAPVAEANDIEIRSGPNNQPNKTLIGNLLAVATTETVNGPVAVHSINNQDGVGAGKDQYIMYTGDGSTGAGWPPMSSWYVPVIPLSTVGY